MNREELVTALRRMAPETGSLCCLGCGYEYGCSTHGCAIIKAAVEAIKAMPLPPSNQPLILEELRKMDGPVWICYLQETWGPHSTKSGSMSCARYKFSFENYGKTWLAYRRKPEEDANT